MMADPLSADGVLPGSPLPSPQLTPSPKRSDAEKQELRKMLSTKSKSQRDELVHRVERVDAALAATTGLVANQTDAQHAAAELHRNVSQIVTTADREAGELWTQTLAKSRVLHEKVAGQLKTKAERRRAEQETPTASPKDGRPTPTTTPARSIL